MKFKIVTISREFGSGGREIAKKLAEKLGYNYYDNELVTKIAKESGFTESIVKETQEDAAYTNSLLFNLSLGNMNANGLSLYDQLFIAQRKILMELAEKENCVIVGRCADYILSDRTDCLNVFIHANIDFRVDRVTNIYGENHKYPAKTVKNKDKKRRNYYNYFTDKQWGKLQNYHISLDSSVLGIEKCCDIISSAIF